ncbi:MAG TPA: hypothetical protein ENJ01_10935 [Gammaproteobacteria bacterium]|nr:hypothetical protein [Gammaproteobacteria bacterium]
MRHLFLLILFLVPLAGQAAGTPPLRVRVADPFIELHGGPGASYPVYDVVERGEFIEILRRRTDWFEVRASKNRQGWVKKQQLEETLQRAQVPPTWRDNLVEKVLADRFRFGAAGGIFDQEGIITIRAGYRTSEHISVEMALSTVSGIFADSALIQANVLVDIQVLDSLRPFFLIGYSRFLNVPDNLGGGGGVILTNRHNLDMLNAGFGVQWFITDRFLIRGEVVEHATVRGNNRSDRFSQFNAGVSYFF